MSVHTANSHANQNSGSPKYLYFAFLTHSEKAHRADIRFRYPSRSAPCFSLYRGYPVYGNFPHSMHTDCPDRRNSVSLAVTAV